MLQEVELLAGLLAQIAEILVMRMAQIGDDADGGADDTLQPHHLPGLGDACLKQGQSMLGAKFPNRKRHAHLRVVALRASHNVHIGREQLMQPFLDDGLAIAACDAHHGDIGGRTLGCSNALQGSERIVHRKEDGIRAAVGMEILEHHKSADALGIQFLYEAMSMASSEMTAS